jgi:hypothetical protein
MSREEHLHDVSVREHQLAAHILRSPEYLRRADQELKRQVSMLYLAIALLVIFQGLFTFRAEGEPITGAVVLITVTSALAIVNCLLLIRTKSFLRRINERWIGPQERSALNALRSQRSQILTRIPHNPAEIRNAELN